MIFTEKKNIFKNTTDVAAVIAFLCAAFLVFVAHEGFKPTKDAAEFYEVTQTAVYIGVAISFFISIVANIASRKSPFVGFAFSLLPLWYVLNCFAAEKLTGDNPMLYVVLAAVHAIGSLVYTLWWVFDRDGEKDFSRALTCGISAIMLVFTFFYICSLAEIDPKYGMPLAYLRWGFVYTSIACSLAGLLRVRNIEKGKRYLASLVVVGMGLAFSLISMIVEYNF